MTATKPRVHFFDIGGHSLLMVRLVREVERRTGHEVPPTILLQAGTIAALAGVLETDRRKPAPSLPLVPLQPAGSKPPLFWIHPLVGFAFPYVHLARRLGTQRPFYALQAAGLGDGRPFNTRVESMAAHYLESIRRVQEQGPYHVGGWSLGGLVAFELAQQLHRAGEEVAPLFIQDTPASLEHLSVPKRWVSELAFWGLAGLEIWPFVGGYLDIQFPSPAGPSHLRRRPGQIRRALTAGGTLTPSYLARHVWTNLRAARAYRPEPYPGRITLLRADEQPIDEAHDLGWANVAQGRLDVRRVSGNHFTSLQPPHVDHLAQTIDQLLRDV